MGGTGSMVGRGVRAAVLLGVVALGLPLVPGALSSAAAATATAPGDLPVSSPEPMPWNPVPLHDEPLPADAPVAPSVAPPPVGLPVDSKMVHVPGEEIVDLRTETSKVFATADPSRNEARLYSGPVHFRDAEGAWREIDTTLASVGSVARPAATGFGLELPLNATAGLVRFEVDASHSVSYSLAGALPTVGALAGPTVTHDEVLPGVGIELTALTRGVKEELVLSSPATPREYLFALGLEGLTASIDSLGDVILRDQSGTARVRFPAGFMIDSNTSVDGAEGVESSGGVTYELVAPVPGVQLLRMRLDDAWLDAPERVFPVRVDPTQVLIGADADDTYVNSCYPNNDYSTLVHSKAGGSDCQRAHYAKFNLAAVAGKTIDSAELSEYNEYSYSCQARTVNVYRVTQSWVGSGVRSWPGPSFATPAVATAYESHGYNTGCPGASIKWPITDLVRQWQSGALPNYGISLRVTDTTSSDPYTYKEFKTSETGIGTPHLIVLYSEPNNPFGNLDSATDGTERIRVQGWAADADAKTSPVTVHVYVGSTGYNIGPANTYRPDVGAAYPGYGNYHGFDAYVPAVAGTHQVCAYGINIGVGGNPQLACKTVTVSTNPPNVTKTADRSLVSVGDTVTFTLQVDNDSLSTRTITSITDPVPAGLMVLPGSLRTFVSGNTTPQVCTTAPSCSFSLQTLNVSSFTLQPGASRTLTYAAIAVGDDRGCAEFTNTATVVSSSGPTVLDDATVTVCSGTGLEQWWSFVDRPAAAGGAAHVNVANGNAVLQQLDSTPVQAQGDLAHVLRRTYNSLEPTGSPLTDVPIGAGWQLNVGQADSLLAGGIGASGLLVPTLGSPLDAAAVVLRDRDGTRHVFRPASTSAAVDLSTISPTGPLGTLVPRLLSAGTGFKLCADVTYRAPAGVHLAMWRYVRINTSSSCGNLAGATGLAVVGFAAERPDRLRYEFSWDGRLVDLVDANGVALRHVYEQPVPVPGVSTGRLLAVYEPESCVTTQPAGEPVDAADIPVSCRTLRFTYTAASGPTGARVAVVDPAGRTTTYQLDTSSPARLIGVANPDGSTLTYAYGGCGGTTDQLCAATDARANTLRFAYSQVGTGRPRVTAVTDRRTNPTTIAYTASTAVVDQAGHRQSFQSLDTAGRAGAVWEGTTANSWARQTNFTWDTAASPCREPDDLVDNNLCRRVRLALPGTTAPQDDRSWLYNAEGNLLRERRTAGAVTLDTTHGYRTQTFPTSGTVQVVEDRVTGSGNVTVPTRITAGTTPLFAISDRIESLTPRGNTAGAVLSTFRTNYKVDANTATSPNRRPSGPLCANPATPVANTGNVCETDAPGSDPTGRAVTRYGYNTFGQRTTMTTPKAIAEGQSSSKYVYDYYGPTDTDLTGTVRTAGWLKAVTDPAGGFVVYAYDRAGNVVRTWDRDATSVNADTQPAPGLAAYPGTITAPTTGDYTEVRYGPGSATAAFSSPWRWSTLERNALGDSSTYVRDGNGNPTQIRPPRGVTAGNDQYDTIQTFTADDQVATRVLPEERAADKATQYQYDAFGNQTAVIDPRGKVTTTDYDTVNRAITRAFTRGAWTADSATALPDCTQSTAAHAPMPTGRERCTTRSDYDSLDNVISTRDADGQNTTYTYDGFGRRTVQLSPRNDGTLTTLRTETVYDPDGNVLRVCAPRQFTEGDSICDGDARYGQHSTYDTAGRVRTTTRYRDTTALVATTGYDADGNPVSVTDPNGHTATSVFDLLARKQSTTVPRATGVSHTTTWQHSPAGDVTAVTTAALNLGDGRDGALVIDGASASSDGQAHPRSNPYRINPGTDHTSITLINGGWIAPPLTGTHTAAVIIRATGSITVCSTCGIDADATVAAGYANGGPGGSDLAGGSGGGGAGHATSGQAGQTFLGHGASGGAGAAYGAADASDRADLALVRGSKGGNGGTGTLSDPGGPGGAGGGFVQLTASTIDVAGEVTADGANGTSVPSSSTAGSGGGGSGGTVLLQGSTVTVATGALSVTGGNGGTGSTTAMAGGNGAVGRIVIHRDQGTGTAPGATTAPAGDITAYSYDPTHRVVDKVTGASNLGALPGTLPTSGRDTRTRVIYDPDGNTIAVYEPRAFATSISNPDERFMARTDYDRNGRPTAQYLPRHDSTNHSNSDATGTQAAQCPTTVDPVGAPTYPSDVGVCVTRVGYDEAGNRATLVLPTAAGAAVSPPPAKRIDFTYSDDNRPVTVDAPNPTGIGRVTAARYLHDGDGMILRATDANDNARTTTYTPDNLVATETGQPGAGAVTHLTRYTYNANAARTTVVDAVGQTWTTSYTTDDRQYRVADPMGNTTEYGYDPNGNPTSVLRPESYARRAASQPYGADISEFSFDNLLAATTRPVTHDGTQRRRVDYGYDAAGRKTSQRTATINPAGALTGDGGTQWFAWHPNGLAASETGRNGEGIAYTYDPAGNMVTATDSTHRETNLSNTWFLDGTLRTTTSGADTSRYGYDGAGSVTFRQYETTGRNIVARYAYNDAGLPATSTLDGQSGQYAWRYDPAGRPVEIDYPTGQDILLEWNTDDTLSNHTARTAAGTQLAWFAYSYDNLSRQITQTHATLAGVGGAPVTGTLSYKYDPAGRLDEWRDDVTITDVDHDRNANRTRVGTDVFTYNADDTLATATTAGTTRTSTYDPAGRLNTDGCRTHTYDGFDRTTQAAPQAGATGCGTQPTVTWRYDPLDRQRTRTESGASTRATTYSYDGLTQTETLETDQGTQRGWYIDPNGTRRAHVTYGVVNTTTMLFDDGQANTSTVTNAAGAVDCTLRYDPWGNPLNPRAIDNPCNSGTAPNTILFNGNRRDRTNGTYQLGSRTYDPTKAAFTTPDSYRADNWNKDLSIGTDPLTSNRYTYVNGDPINLTDPSGHRACDDARHCEAPRSPRGPSAVQRCTAALRCTIRQFDSMSIGQRATWLDTFRSDFARQYNAEDWFNNIDGVLRFFREEGLGKSGTWVSYVDAAILQGIQHGMAEAEGLRTNGTNPGGPAWADFFRAAKRAGSRPSAREAADLRSRWGEAEQNSTDRGFQVAKRHGLSPTAKENFVFREVGNFYRAALIDPDSAAGQLGGLSLGCGLLSAGGGFGGYYCVRDVRDQFFDEIDPRNRTATYENATTFWATPKWVDDPLSWFLP